MHVSHFHDQDLSGLTDQKFVHKNIALVPPYLEVLMIMSLSAYKAAATETESKTHAPETLCQVFSALQLDTFIMALQTQSGSYGN